MGYGSQAGQVGFGIQSAKGTGVAATMFSRLRSGGLGGDRSLLIPDPEIGGNRDISGAYLGPVAFNGDLEFYVRLRAMAMFLKAALGTSSSTAATAATETQTVTLTGTPTGGTFTLKFRGVTTAPIAYNATAANVISALVTASTAAGTGVFLAGDATGAGGALPAVVTLTFAQQYASVDVPLLVADGSLLTGGTSPAAVIATGTAGLAPIGTHVITGADTLPWVSIEERLGSGLESFSYKDGKFNSLKMTADANGYVMGSASVSALSQVAGFTAQTNPAWDTTPGFVGSQLLVYFNGTLLPAKTFNMEINNNIEVDDFVLGSVFRSDMTEKRREIKLGLSYRPTDSAIWRGAMYGSTVATGALAGPAYQGSMKIVLKSYETINNTVSGTPFSLTVDIPNAMIAPYKINPSGDDVIQTDLEITPARPDNAVPIITCTVVDDRATVV